MLPVNGFLEKAFSQFYAGEGQMPAPNAAPAVDVPLLTTAPLVFLSPDFRLEEKEDALLQSLIYQHRLTTNLTLFDLLFFDLHTALTQLKNLFNAIDFEREIETLENCYALLIESEKKDTAQLRIFLENVIKNALESNTDLNRSSGNLQLTKCAGDLKYISETLSDRVQLFKKFENEASCHGQLFNHPLSELVGEQLPLFEGNIATIFANNGAFLAIVFNALARCHPECRNFEKQARILEEVSDLGRVNASNFVGQKVNPSQIAQDLEVGDLIGPVWKKMFYESFAVYQEIVENYREFNRQHQTLHTELAFQTGNIPFLPYAESLKGMLDPNDKLAEFRVEKIIDPSFQLTQAESELIQDLFNSYPLDFKITMLDLLGFALYDRLEKLKKIIPRINDEITKTQGLFSAYCLTLYVGLYRATPEVTQLLGAVNNYSEKFALYPHTFPQRVERLLEELQQKIEGLKPMTRNPTKGQMQALKEQQTEMVKEIKEGIMPLRNMLIKLLKAKGSFELLLRTLSMYQGSQALKEPHPTERETVERYWNYVRNGYLAGFKAKFIGLKVNFDDIMGDRLPFSEHPLERETVSVGKKIAGSILVNCKTLSKMQKDLAKAASGQLSHQAWVDEGPARGKLYQKAPEEFKELLFSHSAFVQMCSGFFCDVLRLLEKSVFPHGTVTTEACFQRLRYNIELRRISFSGLPTPISSKLQVVLDPIETHLEQYQQILDSLVYHPSFASGQFNYGKCLELLVLISDPTLSLFESSLKILRSLKVELLQDLKKDWSALTLEELQSLDVPATKEAFFQDGLRLLRPLLILSDILALFQTRCFTEEAAIIPKELADIMLLDGIDEVLEGLIKAKMTVVDAPEEKSQPTTVATTIVEVPAEVVETIAASAKTRPTPAPKKLSAAARKQQARVAARQGSTQTTTTTTTQAEQISPEVRDLAYLTKAREILKRLKEMHFFEDHKTGSHHIMKNPQGGTVTVPENDNLPRGTRQSIMRQTDAALKI